MNRAAIHALQPAITDAGRLASHLGLPLHVIEVHRFPDGELRVTIGAVTETAIVYAPLDQPNDKLLALLFAAEAFRREGVARLLLVAPYLSYMRQDIAERRGDQPKGSRRSDCEEFRSRRHCGCASAPHEKY